MANMDDLRAVHWEYGTSTVTYQSEAGAQFMSEERERLCQEHARQIKEPESMALGKELRTSHIQLSHRADPATSASESKSRYVPSRAEPPEGRGSAGRANIVFSVRDQSCSDWQSVSSAAAATDVEQKFACTIPKAFVHLGQELRKSSIPFRVGQQEERHMSTTKKEFGPKQACQAQSFSETVGKDLRRSHLAVAYGSRSTKEWLSEAQAASDHHADKKWKCERPAGFEQLGKELRKTHITLGSDSTVDYSQGRATTPGGSPLVRTGSFVMTRPAGLVR